MRVADELPPAVAALLDGTDPEGRVGETVLLIAVDDGSPRVTSLSVGELLATEPGTVLATLYATSRTARALAATGSGTLLVVADGELVKIEVDARVLGEDAGRVDYRLGVQRVEVDAVPYARVTHGIRFELVDHHDRVLERWRSQLDHLKGLA